MLLSADFDNEINTTCASIIAIGGVFGVQFCRSLLPVILIRVPMQMKRVCRNILLHCVLKEEDSCPGVDAGPDVDGSAATCALDDVDVPVARGEYFVRHMCIYMFMK